MLETNHLLLQQKTVYLPIRTKDLIKFVFFKANFYKSITTVIYNYFFHHYINEINRGRFYQTFICYNQYRYLT